MRHDVSRGGTDQLHTISVGASGMKPSFLIVKVPRGKGDSFVRFTLMRMFSPGFATWSKLR